MNAENTINWGNTTIKNLEEPISARQRPLPLHIVSFPNPSIAESIEETYEEFNELYRQFGYDRLYNQTLHELAHLSAYMLLAMPGDHNRALENLLEIVYTQRRGIFDALWVNDLVSLDQSNQIHFQEAVTSGNDASGKTNMRHILKSIPTDITMGRSNEQINELIINVDMANRYTLEEINATYLILKTQRDLLDRHADFDFSSRADGNINFEKKDNPDQPVSASELFSCLDKACTPVIDGTLDSEINGLQEARKVLYLRNMRILMSYGWSQHDSAQYLNSAYNFSENVLAKLTARLEKSIKKGKLIKKEYATLNHEDTGQGGPERDSTLTILLPSHLVKRKKNIFSRLASRIVSKLN